MLNRSIPIKKDNKTDVTTHRVVEYHIPCPDDANKFIDIKELQPFSVDWHPPVSKEHLW